MTKGIAVPVRPGPTGGVATLDADADADKTIRLALADNDNDNAFQQDIGLGTQFIFDVRNPSFRARVLARLFRIFDAFDRLKLFRLVRTSIKWSNGGKGEQILEFKYINLESDQPRDFSQTFSSGGQ